MEKSAETQVEDQQQQQPQTVSTASSSTDSNDNSTTTTTTTSSTNDKSEEEPKAEIRTRIRISNNRGLFFFVNLAKKYMAQMPDTTPLDLSAIGAAINTAVSCAEILKNNKLVTLHKIETSTVVLQAGGGRTANKPKMQIYLLKTAEFDTIYAQQNLERKAKSEEKRRLKKLAQQNQAEKAEAQQQNDSGNEVDEYAEPQTEESPRAESQELSETDKTSNDTSQQ